MRTEARPHGRFSPVLAYASAPHFLFSLAHSIAPKPPLGSFACRLAQYHDLKAISDLDLEGSNFAYQVDMALGMNTRDGESFWMDEETGRIKYPSDEFVFGFCDALTTSSKRFKKKSECFSSLGSLRRRDIARDKI
jgi:hypothetical protein